MAAKKKPLGRPPAKIALEAQLQIRLTAASLEAIRQMADDEQRSLAQMARILLERQLEAEAVG